MKMKEKTMAKLIIQLQIKLDTAAILQRSHRWDGSQKAIDAAELMLVQLNQMIAQQEVTHA